MRKHKTERDFQNLARLSSYLKDKKEKDRLRYQRLAVKSGLARCSVSKIINGKQDINFSTLLKLCDAMGLEVHISEKTK